MRTTRSTTRTTSTKTKTSTSDASLDAAEQRLKDLLASCESVIVAFSGGVDSAYLGWAAKQVLGAASLCVTADSPSYPEHHRRLARRVAAEFGLAHEIIHTGEIDLPEYRANPVNRCYYCKHELYRHLTAMAAARGFRVVVDGNNADDRSDHRPGRIAARQFGVRSPLDEAGLTKHAIRELSRRAGLPTWDEPASACLSSRIPYHSEVTPEKLRMIERAEAVLRELGFRVCRVRHHESPAPARQVLARLEIGRDEMARAFDPPVRERILNELQVIGYSAVAIDLRGYRSGSLNEGITLTPV